MTDSTGRRLALAIIAGLWAAPGLWAQAPGAVPDVVPTDVRPRGYRIIIRDRRSNLDAIAKLIKEHDKAPREVRIESYVLELSLNENNNTGVDLNFFFGGSKEDSPLGEFATAGAMRGQGANQQIRFGSLSTEKFQLFLDFLKRNTETKVLSRPMLTVLDGQNATINIGSTIYYVRNTLSAGAVGQQPLQGTEALSVNIGINLSFTPTILPNDIVRLGIAPEITSVEGSPQQNAPPNTSTQRVSTTLFVKNGHAFLIGGLYQTSATKRKARLPLLGNLPIIGDYLGENANTRNRKELIIVVKPTITSEEDFEDIPPIGKKS